MISMRAMGLENRIDDEFERFAKLRGELEKLVPAEVNAEDNMAWVYGGMDDEGWRDEDVDQDEQIEDVRAVLLELLDSTYKLEGFLYTRGVLGG